MIEELRKDEAVPLPDQISSIIRMRIETGEYRPGKRLGSIRQFAKDFSVSPVTVIRALDILEEETLIERVPIKGVFVSDRLKPEKKQLTACFAFPEKEIAPMENAMENWGLNYELYRGLFAGAQQNKINLQFTYFQDKPSPELLDIQKAALRKFDMVIFPGDRQLVELREASAPERLTCYFGSSLNMSSPPSRAVRVDYDRPHSRRSLLEYFLQTGCRSAAALVSEDTSSDRGADFLNRAVKSGIDPAQAELWKIDRREPGSLDKIKAFLQRKAEFIFVHHTEFMPLIFEAAYDLNLTPGKDFIVTAIASGMTFVGLFPRFSYLRIPRYKMGLQLMQSADEIIRSGKKTGTIPELKVEFIQGKKLS
ncbi:MAG: GntR family transcriptional regulator [Lentisphaeria bacterium]|nr:GntR family transcriptional regulator [Lentisphaeria bacterium]